MGLAQLARLSSKHTLGILAYLIPVAVIEQPHSAIEYPRRNKDLTDNPKEGTQWEKYVDIQWKCVSRLLSYSLYSPPIDTQFSDADCLSQKQSPNTSQGLHKTL